jgi:hypothetical protein
VLDCGITKFYFSLKHTTVTASPASHGCLSKVAG